MIKCENRRAYMPPPKNINRSHGVSKMFAESTKEHLRSLKANQRATVLEAIETQLVHEPLTETRHRKYLHPNPIAPWSLRVGNLRVFYETASDEPNVVRILAIGRKEGNRLHIGRKAVQL